MKAHGWLAMAALFWALPLMAGGNWQFTALAGGEAWLHPERGGHGLVLIASDRFGLYRNSHLGAEFNTDTFRLTLDRLRFRNGLIELGIRAAGEARFAGLLSDYYRAGVSDPARGFGASYLAAEAGAKLNLPGCQYLEFAAGGRRWHFSTDRDTSPALVLPPGAWVFEGRLRYTLWRLRADPSLHQRHRLFPRLRGLAAGLEFGLDWRSFAHTWGARDSSAFTPADERNNPGQVILLVRQWLRAGWQPLPRLRFQLAQGVFWSRREDDLIRVRVGGMNPYVVPVAGVPWAAYLASKLVSASLSGHLQVWKDMEAGGSLDGGLLDDPERTGHSDPGPILGASLLVDGRFGPTQVDLRAGWSPGLHGNARRGSRSLFIALGYMWE